MASALRRCSPVRLVAIGLLGPLGLSLACGGGTALVPTAPRPPRDPPPTIVAEPPPPTKVETLPLRRNHACFWRGGYWKPRAGAWLWIKGAWVLPPDDCVVAPAVTHFESVEGSTVLVHRGEVWYRSGGAETCAAPRDCSDL